MTDRKKIDMKDAHHRMDTYYCDFYTCPTCGCDRIIESFNFCPHCGGELDWPAVTIDVNKDEWIPPWLPSDKEIVGLRFYECPGCTFPIPYYEKDTSRIVKKCHCCNHPIIWKGLPE